MVSELSELSVRSQTVFLSKQKFCQCQTVATLNVSEGTLHGSL